MDQEESLTTIIAAKSGRPFSLQSWIQQVVTLLPHKCFSDLELEVWQTLFLDPYPYSNGDQYTLFIAHGGFMQKVQDQTLTLNDPSHWVNLVTQHVGSRARMYNQHDTTLSFSYHPSFPTRTNTGVYPDLQINAAKINQEELTAFSLLSIAIPGDRPSLIRYSFKTKTGIENNSGEAIFRLGDSYRSQTQLQKELMDKKFTILNTRPTIDTEVGVIHHNDFVFSEFGFQSKSPAVFLESITKGARQGTMHYHILKDNPYFLSYFIQSIPDLSIK